MNHPLLVGAVQAGLEVFWWDPLATLAATDARLVDYRFMRITVIQDGVSWDARLNPRRARDAGRCLCESTAFRERVIDVLNGDAHP